jgi:hypothetical protein
MTESGHRQFVGSKSIDSYRCSATFIATVCAFRKGELLSTIKPFFSRFYREARKDFFFVKMVERRFGSKIPKQILFHIFGTKKQIENLVELSRKTFGFEK